MHPLGKKPAEQTHSSYKVFDPEFFHDVAVFIGASRYMRADSDRCLDSEFASHHQLKNAAYYQVFAEVRLVQAVLCLLGVAHPEHQYDELIARMKKKYGYE